MLKGLRADMCVVFVSNGVCGSSPVSRATSFEILKTMGYAISLIIDSVFGAIPL